MNEKKSRIHDWHNLKWPFTVTFLYNSLISLFTGVADWSQEGFVTVLLTIAILDVVAYACYCYSLSRNEENMQKLWFSFILAHVLATTQQLSVVWGWLSANAAAHM